MAQPCCVLLFSSEFHTPEVLGRFEKEKPLLIANNRLDPGLPSERVSIERERERER